MTLFGQTGGKRKDLAKRTKSEAKEGSKKGEKPPITTNGFIVQILIYR